MFESNRTPTYSVLTWHWSLRRYPEKVPFRLTRMLVNAMEVSGIEGNYRSTATSVMRVLRAKSDSLNAMLEAFVHDPLVAWKLLHPNQTPSNDMGGAGGRDASAAGGVAAVASIGDSEVLRGSVGAAPSLVVGGVSDGVGGDEGRGRKASTGAGRKRSKSWQLAPDAVPVARRPSVSEAEAAAPQASADGGGEAVPVEAKEVSRSVLCAGNTSEVNELAIRVTRRIGMKLNGTEFAAEEVRRGLSEGMACRKVSGCVLGICRLSHCCYFHSGGLRLGRCGVCRQWRRQQRRCASRRQPSGC